MITSGQLKTQKPNGKEDAQNESRVSFKNSYTFKDLLENQSPLNSQETT
jgi:hypothetical protein